MFSNNTDKPRRFVDLHVHSCASDGMMTPEELIHLADEIHLAAIALSDHDTTAGIADAREGAAKIDKLTFVPGIEISVKFEGGTMHILGLWIDETVSAIQDLVNRVQHARAERNPKIIAKLREMGLDITMRDVLDTAAKCRSPRKNTIISRVHIAQAMHQKGLVDSTEEAFSKYIDSGAPAYVHKDRPTPSEAITAIKDAGGLAILAHPPQLNYDNLAQLKQIVRNLMHAGLAGIEAYHSSHSPDQSRSYIDLANELDLAITGGSDFHGTGWPDKGLGQPRVPLSAVTGEAMQRLKDNQ